MKKISSGPGWNFIKGAEPKPANSFCARATEGQVKIHLEKRSGKKITVITGLHTYGSDRLNAIAKELKTCCGAGGTVKNGTIEIQGDKIARAQAWLKDNL